MNISIFQKGFNYSQDGPGNRLVYHLQGCNLRCPWCANPEGLSASGGAAYSIEALMDEVMRSKSMFFDGGGVTLTGGEVCMQFDAVKDFLTRLHTAGIHTCIETNGTSGRLPELFPVLDFLIMDIKHYDTEKHRLVTGVSCAQTHKNALAAIKAGQKLAVRIPMIGGFNASLADAAPFADLFKTLEIANNATVELLPYHEFGKDKYAALGMDYTMGEDAYVSREILKQFSEVLKTAGFTLIHT